MPASSANAPAARTLFLLVALVALVAGGKAILSDSMDPDCFWHLRVADQLCRDGVGPLVDELSYGSIKTPWTPYSWLAELGMLRLWDLGGYRLAVLAQAIMQAGLIGLIALGCLEARRGEQGIWDGEQPSFLAVGIATAWAALMSVAYLSFRPVLAALIILAAVYWLLLRHRRLSFRSRLVWLCVPLTALLANIHLYVIFAPAMAVCFLVDARKARRSASAWGLLAAVCLAACCTPMLPGVLRSIFVYQSTDNMANSGYVIELQPLWVGWFGKMCVLAGAAAIAAIIHQRRRFSVCDRGLLAIAVLLALRMMRFSPILAILAAPILTRALPGLGDRVLLRRPIVAALALLLAIGVVRLSMAFPSRSMPMSHWLTRNVANYPTAATDHLLAHVPRRTARIINEFDWGGYLSYRLGRDYQVLLDGRTQVYNQQFWNQTYLGGEKLRREFLGSIQADAAVLPMHKSVFAAILTELGWTTIYSDSTARVLVPPTAVTDISR